MRWPEERVASGVESNPRRVGGLHERGELKSRGMKMCPLTARRVGWEGAGSGKMQETGNRSASGSQLTATAAIASV